MKAKARGTKQRASKPNKAKTKRSMAPWMLRLYVAGQTPRSLAAYANLKRVCEENLPDRYWIEVIDLSLQPHLAQNDQIIALPTLVRKRPEPIKRLIGDLSNVERVKTVIDLKAMGGS